MVDEQFGPRAHVSELIFVEQLERLLEVAPDRVFEGEARRSFPAPAPRSSSE